MGHSLGGFFGATIASDPPPELRAVVLIDGGHLGVREFAALGQPAPEASREELLAWVKAEPSCAFRTGTRRSASWRR